MSENITGAELAARIRKLREAQGKTLDDVAEWFSVTKQRINQAEAPKYKGPKLDALRARIYERLKEGAVKVRGPYFVVEETAPLFGQVEQGSGRASEQKSKAA